MKSHIICILTDDTSVMTKIAKIGPDSQQALDTKTRWSSLAIMLKRFFDIRNCIRKALVDVVPTLSFEEWEVTLLSDIVGSLEPIQATVEALCRRDANLITADATIIKNIKRTEQSIVCTII